MNEHAINTTARSFLIVCFRYIGDVLVTTPLAHSIRAAYPDAVIDYLVFAGTDKALAKNPLIRKVITIPKGKGSIGTLISLFRCYDVAFAAYPSDRTVIAAAIAGKQTIGLVIDWPKEQWKKRILGKHVKYNDEIHVVHNLLSILGPLGIPQIPQVSMGYDNDDLNFAIRTISAKQYILIHPYSMKQCKYWPTHYWGALARLISEKTDFTPVFSETPSTEDKAYLDEIRSVASEEVMTFPCNLNQLAAALTKCVAYIGVDTATTHISAAMEVPTIAIFGPSWTRYWAPWPNRCVDHSPFSANKGIQHKGYVTVVQKDWDCVPCNKEFCSITSRNRFECLEAITPEEVFRELMNTIEQ